MERRVAILHFTAEPCIGGVERVIAMQQTVLREAGVPTRLVVGAGGTPDDPDVIRIPSMCPGGSPLHAPIPRPDDPDVERLTESLRRAVTGCSDCWVHNALTVYLHPALTVALLRLIDEMPQLRWVAFCHDLTDASAYWRVLSPEERARIRLPRSGVRYVVDTAVRRAQLAEAGPEYEEILVIEPATDVASWLGMTPESVELAHHLTLLEASPLVLVPAKLLPHKNLQLAVQVVHRLRETFDRPLVLISGAPSPHDPEASALVEEDLRAAADELQVAANVIILTHVLGKPASAAVLRDLVMLCDLVFLPSAEEGFGLPLREAMLGRAPVLCSDIPPFREVAGGYADFFALEESPTEVAGRIASIVRTPAQSRRREALRSREKFRRLLLELLSA